MLAKLAYLGCDILWLLNGETTTEVQLRQCIIELEAEIKQKDEMFEKFKKEIEEKLEIVWNIIKELKKI